MAKATGGTITYSGGKTIHTFTSNGTFTPGLALDVAALAIGGGAAGGGQASNGTGSGGGGGGGYQYDASFAVTAQAYSIVVGTGGVGFGGTGMSGGNSTFSTISATGGGGGGARSIVGVNGGCGGGSGSEQASKSTGSQGGNGGAGAAASHYPGGGGGGATGNGADAVGATGGGNGGNGTANSISGSSVTYAGGGGGGTYNGGTTGTGGTGGGGAGGASGGNNDGVDGTDGLGGGGGGGTCQPSGSSDGGDGGDGIVIISYTGDANSLNPADWESPNEIVSDNTKVSGSSNLTNYPSLIADGNLTDAVYAGLLSTGADLRITTDSAGTTEIPFEIVDIDTTAKTSEIWAKVPSMLYASDTSLFIWYGNSSAVAYAASDTFGSEAVWSDYKAVYHLESLTADSTSGDFTLTNTNTVGSDTGQIGSGADFGTSNSDKKLSVANDLGITNGNISMSIWAKANTELGANFYGFVGKGDSGSHINYLIYYDYNGGTRRVTFNRQRQDTSNNVVQSNLTMGTSAWYHIILTYDGTTLRGYVDGSSVGTPLATSGDGGGRGTESLIIGEAIAVSANSYASIDTDEVRVTSTVLTADWITTEYNNQSSPSTFWTQVSSGISTLIGGGIIEF